MVRAGIFIGVDQAGDLQKLSDATKTLQEAIAAGLPGAERFAGAMQHVVQPFGPEHFESQCGIKVHGKLVPRGLPSDAIQPAGRTQSLTG